MGSHTILQILFCKALKNICLKQIIERLSISALLCLMTSRNKRVRWELTPTSNSLIMLESVSTFRIIHDFEEKQTICDIYKQISFSGSLTLKKYFDIYMHTFEEVIIYSNSTLNVIFEKTEVLLNSGSVNTIKRSMLTLDILKNW